MIMSMNKYVTIESFAGKYMSAVTHINLYKYK